MLKYSGAEGPSRRRHAHAFQLIIFFPLHSPVLEPDFNLSLGEAKSMCYFNPSSAGQIAVEMELLLQLQGLVARVGRSGPFAFRAAYVVCNRKVSGLATHSSASGYQSPPAGPARVLNRGEKLNKSPSSLAHPPLPNFLPSSFLERKQ